MIISFTLSGYALKHLSGHALGRIPDEALARFSFLGLQNQNQKALAAALAVLLHHLQGNILIGMEKTVAEIVPLLADGDGLGIHFIQVGL